MSAPRGYSVSYGRKKFRCIQYIYGDPQESFSHRVTFDAVFLEKSCDMTIRGF